MNFQLKETAPKSSKFSPKGVGYKLFGERASYFNMENKEEIWKDIIGFEGYYQVSNFGNVKSLDRLIISNRSSQRLKSQAIKKTNRSGRGDYFVVILYKNSIGKTMYVHRLVARAFIPNPENKQQVNHMDGNSTNNHYSNLEWNTVSENNTHKYRVLKNPPVTGNSRIKTIKISLDGFVLNVYDSQLAAAIDNGIHKQSVNRCCKLLCNSVKGYIYR
jgi:hypothetical protein